MNPNTETAGRLFRRYRLILGLTYVGIFLVGALVFRVILIDHEKQIVEITEERLSEHALLFDALAKLTGDHVQNLKLFVEHDLSRHGSQSPPAAAGDTFKQQLANLQRRFQLMIGGAVTWQQLDARQHVVWGDAAAFDADRIQLRTGPGANPARRLIWETLAASQDGDPEPKRAVAAAIVISAPLYQEDGFLGTVSLAIDMAQLTRISDEFSYPVGKILLIDARGRLLTQPIGHTLSASDEALLGQYTHIPARRMVETHGHLLFHQPLSFAPWTIVYAAPQAALQRIALAESSLLGVTILISIVVMFFISTRLTRREFIGPSQALIRHIENQGQEDASQNAAVPQAWQQWFHRVSAVFAENAATERIRQELEIASRMQASVLPQAFPERPDIALTGRSVSAKEVGGDFYDYFFIDDHRIGIVIADVSGKGVPAALFMMVSRTLNKALAVGGETPGALLRQVNRLLAEENDAAMFVTLFYALIDLRTGVMTYANGGHNPPALVEAGTITWLTEANNIALGALDDFDFSDAKTTLAPNCTLVLYTDGITEAFNAAGEEFGEARLERYLTNAGDLLPERLTEELIQEVAAFSAGEEQSDDITSLIVRFSGPARTDEAQLTISESWRVPARADSLPQIVGKLDKFYDRAGIDAESAGQITLSVDELVTNIISYGADAGMADAISIDLSIQTDGLEVVIDIKDSGVAFDPFSVPVPDLEAEAEDRDIGGLGVHFVRTLMDDVSYIRVDEQNCVTLKKKLHGKAAPRAE